ncbi:MAG TPA: hypothetical protein VHP32_00775 [Ignavibacteria bacterium]|nr:hypothetical protein [Ignavibacteria bacterium]
MTDKIEISFDDDEKGKIEVNLEQTLEEQIIIADKITEPASSIIVPANFYYAGNQGANKFYDSLIEFPGGIESGFRKKFSIEFKDEFYSSVLADNKNLVLVSTKGTVYFIDKDSGELKGKVVLDNELVEKTGLIVEDEIYVNSLKRIYKVSESNKEALFNADESFYIWTNLNRYENNLLFAEYSDEQKKCRIILYDVKQSNYITLNEVKIEKFVSDRIVVHNEKAYFIFDDKCVIINLKKNETEIIELGFETNERSFIFAINKGIVLVNNNEVYFLDVMHNDNVFKFTGIKENFINSGGGSGENVFLGTGSGWYHYKINGVLVTHYEDTEENIIEAISKNVLAISRRNKVIFYNLNKIQEAEGFILSSKDFNITQEIISVVFDRSLIYVLTHQGVLTAFSNDKLNIHI